MSSRLSRRWCAGVIALASASLLVVSTLGANAAPHPSDLPVTQGLRKAVTTAGMFEHLSALQQIADHNGGNRVSGFPAYDKSVDYVEGRLTAAGYDVTVQPFEFPFNADRTPPVFQQNSPAAATYVDGIDFASMTYSGNGDVTAAVTAVDLVVPAPGPSNGNTSGCETTDFAASRPGPSRWSSAAPVPSERRRTTQRLPAPLRSSSSMRVSRDALPPWRARSSARREHSGHRHHLRHRRRPAQRRPQRRDRFEARVRVDRVNETRVTYNVLAETPTGDPNNVVVVGAHLDSVPRGPGINDNGSGSAGILEIAETIAARDLTPRNKIRFALFGAEEFGLLGSRHYVGQLSPAEKDAIALNLNFDMIGSPNYVRFVYDGDNSKYPVGTGSADGPQGSGEIERVFHDYFTGVGLASSETPFSGRSDYGPFIEQGIPAGGLFTGAEGVKTADEAAIYGGTAGVAYDPCYHLACDNIDNVNRQGIDEMADAAAHATWSSPGATSRSTR